jgi:hypothetical protein
MAKRGREHHSADYAFQTHAASLALNGHERVDVTLVGCGECKKNETEPWQLRT